MTTIGCSNTLIYQLSFFQEDNSSELYATVDDNIAETLSPQVKICLETIRAENREWMIKDWIVKG